MRSSSFNGSKIVTGSAAGALLGDDEVLLARGRRLSHQARELGPNYSNPARTALVHACRCARPSTQLQKVPHDALRGIACPVEVGRGNAREPVERLPSGQDSLPIRSRQDVPAVIDGFDPFRFFPKSDARNSMEGEWCIGCTRPR